MWRVNVAWVAALSLHTPSLVARRAPRGGGEEDERLDQDMRKDDEEPRAARE